MMRRGFYKPQAGRGAEEQLKLDGKVSKAWKKACRKHPKAWRVLAGDTNLRGLDESNGGRGSRVKKTFCNHFLREMRVATWYKEKSEPTHDKGGMPDVILIGEGIEIKSFGIGGREWEQATTAWCGTNWHSQEATGEGNIPMAKRKRD